MLTYERGSRYATRIQLAYVSVYYICVLMLLYMCPHATVYSENWGSNPRHELHTTIGKVEAYIMSIYLVSMTITTVGTLLLQMCYCVCATVYVFSSLLYMCPHACHAHLPRFSLSLSLSLCVLIQATATSLLKTPRSAWATLFFLLSAVRQELHAIFLVFFVFVFVV